MSLQRFFATALFIGLLGGGVMVIFLLNVLHLILHRRLEKILLRQPYYSPGEIGFFSVWPFSTTITSAYILLITIPAIPKMKRFATFDEPLPNNIFLRILCWSMHVFFTITIFSFFATGGWMALRSIIS